MGVQVVVKRSNGDKLTVEADLDGTVLAFKEVLESLTQVPPSLQRLIYKGKVLKDENTLASYDVEADQTLYFVKGAVSKPTPTPAAAPAVAPTPPAAAPSQSSPFGIPPTNPVASPFGGAMNPFGGAPAGGWGTPPPNVQSMMQNPEMMQQMMDSPMVQNMLSNPEIMRGMMQANPAMRTLLEQNPELNHVMNDPELLRRSMEAMRNPAAMREMMRNQDTALRNIESHPEGFNALRRMYTEVQEPLLNATASNAGIGASNPAFVMPGAVGGSTATSPATTTTTSSTSNPWAAASSSSSTSPNPWGTPPSFPSANPFIGGGFDPNMLNNPMVQGMMQQMAENPAMMRSMMEMNPQFQQLDPATRDMMLNPDVLRTMMNPANLHAMMQLQQAMQQSSSGGGTNTLFGAPTAATPGTPFFPGAPASTNPEDLYSSQLSQLVDMGFTNREQNLRALQATFGNVNAAVDRILSGLS
ncbi:hypothetical protein DYB37_006684 [Aphanomyces astaci]|uniref:Ubiquitin-like domain-containing protein n=2 Tax=Aphanomyces astaci TaxID=112090 RepID=A0A397AKC1_APHAT|nr:hypothetical protein DYB25_002000 [Aphanomyces astaci]RHY19134.1 hypothetical protein DYB36_010484 [Aphanomyces astaci]RHY58657.1 hypothetical protein DYB34_010603 [Aphanomyces astaci]RHY63018.1 hypothetical protein DYB38_003444 [Aphanomyces astaci]RHY66250.1 hypothetical protein DYB30_009611 [Aphanomyces astaci]